MSQEPIIKTSVLTTDGSSDRVLERILQWLIIENTDQRLPAAIQFRFEFMNNPRGATLRQRLQNIHNFYSGAYPDVIFVHRDAESTPIEARRKEIENAFASFGSLDNIPYICLIPVRMTETWLLFDEAAIRQAAGNPNGRQRLQLPPLASLENTPDTKSLLKELLTEASGLNASRRAAFQRQLHARIHDVADHVEDFSPLRNLSAFRDLEKDVRTLLEMWGMGG